MPAAGGCSTRSAREPAGRAAAPLRRAGTSTQPDAGPPRRPARCADGGDRRTSTPTQDAGAAAGRARRGPVLPDLDASEWSSAPNHTHVLTRPEAMAARFAEHPEAVAETVRLAEHAAVRPDRRSRLPLPRRRMTADATRELARGLPVEFERPLPAGHRHRSEAQRRLEQELSIIDHLGLSGFFFLHHEILELAREVAVEVRGPDTASALLPPGRGRGSSVSSIVCYLTGLSHIDPIANELAIGRFLHEDIDRPARHRHRLPPRHPREADPAVHEHYGNERAALGRRVPHLSRLGVRSASWARRWGCRPGRSSGWPAARRAWGGAGHRREGHPDRARRAASLPAAGRGSPRWPTRPTASHDTSPSIPAGWSSPPSPLIDCCPVVPAAMEGRQMVQWDKDSCSDAGFLKIDLLGLGMLSAVERCVEMIAARHGERIDLSRIPFDDQPTYRGDPGRRHRRRLSDREPRADGHRLRRTRPASLADLTIQVALVRPGPIVGGSVNPYIERRQQLADRPRLSDPLPAPLASRSRSTDARDDHLPGPGDRSRPRVRRVHRRAGREPATRDEPQALPGGDRRAPRAVHPRALARPTPTPPSRWRAGVGDGRRVRRVRVSQGPRRRLRPARPTSRPGCGSTTPQSSCARC